MASASPELTLNRQNRIQTSTSSRTDCLLVGCLDGQSSVQGCSPRSQRLNAVVGQFGSAIPSVSIWLAISPGAGDRTPWLLPSMEALDDRSTRPAEQGFEAAIPRTVLRSAAVRLARRLSDQGLDVAVYQLCNRSCSKGYQAGLARYLGLQPRRLVCERVAERLSV